MLSSTPISLNPELLNRLLQIVVGAGSSGCVVANRLVQDHGARVLLLESGPQDDSALIKRWVSLAKYCAP